MCEGTYGAKAPNLANFKLINYLHHNIHLSSIFPLGF